MSSGDPEFEAQFLKNSPSDLVSGGTSSGSPANICQYSVYDPINPANNVVTPLWLSIEGSDGHYSGSVTLTAKLEKYADTTYTGTPVVVGSTPFINSANNVDGIYDLTALGSNYLQNAANSGYYKLTVSRSANSCSPPYPASSFVRYFFWNSPPQGTLDVGKPSGTIPPVAAFFTLHTAGSGSPTTSCAFPELTCQYFFGIMVGNSFGNTGTFSGIKMKMERKNGSCGNWVTEFDGMPYPAWDNGGSMDDWSTVNFGIANYAGYLASTHSDANASAFMGAMGGITVGTVYKLTVYVYNTTCTNTPLELEGYIETANYMTNMCKTDGNDEITGIEDAENSAEILVYPNPATSTVQFESSNGVALGNLMVFDNLGRVVYEKEAIKTDVFSVDISRLSPAVYQYQLKDVFGKTYFRGKFLKQ